MEILHKGHEQLTLVIETRINVSLAHNSPGLNQSPLHRIHLRHAHTMNS